MAALLELASRLVMMQVSEQITVAEQIQELARPDVATTFLVTW